MSDYLLLVFDHVDNFFVSHRGLEKEVTMSPLDNFSYYLSTHENILVVLKEGWIGSDESIGGLFNLDGTLISEIPHPGLIYGKFAINGLVSGVKSCFKFIVEPYGNGSSYFLKYNFADQSFESAGNSVR